MDSLLDSKALSDSKNRTKPWGTLHAILCAKNEITTPFAVINSDDYYGRSAIKTLGDYLGGISADSTEHAMVGYVLGNTMSKSGSVSRGVCQVENGYLKSIHENKNIYYEESKIISESPDGIKTELSSSDFVSMNLFGFATCALNDFEPFWQDFIARNSKEAKAECLLPIAVGDMIEKGYGKIKFFNSTEKWFGMTYKEDRQIVKTEIAAMVEKGVYPKILW